jgi:hypothetical protein
MLQRLLPLLFIAALTAHAAEARPAHHPARHHASRPIPVERVTYDLGVPVAEALRAKAQRRRVLVAFDIDNTLLTTRQDVGGDSWYVWKRGQDDAATPQGRAAVSDLLRDNSALLELSAMKPTQADAAALIAKLQAKGVAVYALSARGADLRGATERALGEAGIDLSSAPECGPPLCVKRGKLGEAQIHAASARAGWPQTGPFRPVTVSDGVMLVAGQDKGLMLDLLLASLPTRYDEVWFVDDTQDNVEHVIRAAPHIAARLHPFAYSRLWLDAADFMQSKARQEKAEQDMAAFRAGVCAALDSEICATQ